MLCISFIDGLTADAVRGGACQCLGRRRATQDTRGQFEFLVIHSSHKTEGLYHQIAIHSSNRG